MEIEMKCDKCDADVPSGTVTSCWKDKYLPDHVGLCCSCFDVGNGMRPPVILGLRTAASIDDEFDLSDSDS